MISIKEYKEMALDIYQQHFNPEFVDKNDIPMDAETLILDYAESFRLEHIGCDPDLLHSELLKIIAKKKDDNKVYLSDINREIAKEMQQEKGGNDV